MREIKNPVILKKRKIFNQNVGNTLRQNTIICGITEFRIDAAYRAGANAMRSGLLVGENIYPQGSYQQEQWAAGYLNESSGEHLRFGLDVIEQVPVGRCFKEDPDAARAQERTAELIKTNQIQASNEYKNMAAFWTRSSQPSNSAQVNGDL